MIHNELEVGGYPREHWFVHIPTNIYHVALPLRSKGPKRQEITTITGNNTESIVGNLCNAL